MPETQLAVAHSYETVRLLRRDAEAWIVLSRPASMNAWNVQLGLDLGDAVRTVADDDDVRVVVVTGEGRAFSAGADLKAGFDATPEGHPDVRGPLRGSYHPLILAIRELPKPVVAAVNGPAVGIGCSLALACDLVVARESAYFLLAFVNIGLVPDGGSSAFLPTRAGMARATEMMMLGERIPARQALEWGLVNRVWDDDAFTPGVDALAARLAQGPPRAYAGIKRQLNAWAYPGLEDQLELEAELQQDMAESADFREGVLAFLEKRAARFHGG